MAFLQWATNTLKSWGIMSKTFQDKLEEGGPQDDSFNMVINQLLHELLKECEKERKKGHLTQCLENFTAFFTNVVKSKKWEHEMKIGSIEFKDHYSEYVTLENFLKTELKDEAKESDAWEELRDKQIQLKLRPKLGKDKVDLEKEEKTLVIEDSFKERLEEMGPESIEFDMVEHQMLRTLLMKCNDERVYQKKQIQAVLAQCLKNFNAFFKNSLNRLQKQGKEIVSIEFKIVSIEFQDEQRYELTNWFFWFKLQDEVSDTSKPWNPLRGGVIELKLTDGELIEIKDKRKEEQIKDKRKEEQTTNRQKDEM